MSPLNFIPLDCWMFFFFFFFFLMFTTLTYLCIIPQWTNWYYKKVLLRDRKRRKACSVAWRRRGGGTPLFLSRDVPPSCRGWGGWGRGRIPPVLSGEVGWETSVLSRGQQGCALPPWTDKQTENITPRRTLYAGGNYHHQVNKKPLDKKTYSAIHQFVRRKSTAV